ncbi:imidazole glycerol phosphate synthase subunit HisH [Gammaproteobacteria bacterium]|nr:imidazole glycerol phosphate synthase subunit HisH [Gammaproteobacteria bacterium]
MRTINVLKLDGSNYKNVLSAIEWLSFPVSQVSIAKICDLEDGSSLIIPGIGHISGLCEQVDKEIQTTVLRELITSKNLYVIGICLGFHFLCCSTEEDSSVDCLGLLPLAIKQLHNSCVPEVGWKKVRRPSGLNKKSNLFTQEDNFFYFSHSFGSEDVTEHAYYYKVGERSIMAFYRQNRMVGMQFHPEKSGSSGLKTFRAVLLGNTFNRL